MTISTTIIKNSYSGDGSVVAFTYAFKIADATFIQVIVKTNATGAESVRAIGTGSTNYAVTGVGEAGGGTVTFVTAPTNAETVVLRRSTTQTQALDLIENDNLPANSLETAFDKNLSLIQELQEELNRSIKISRANTMTSTEFTVGATDRANKILSFNAAGELAVTQELGTFKGDSATTTTAAFVVRDIVKGTTSAQEDNIYICIKASPIGTALTNTTFWVLIVDAVSAATSASTATTKAAEAVTAKNASVVAKDASVVAKDAAIVAKDAAATSATAAASSATSAAASFDAFDDIYLGAKSSDPSTDNDGDGLTTGDQYFNTSSNQLKIYNGSAWQVAAISSTGVVTLAGTETLTNKTLTSPKINENVAVTSTATELNLLDNVSGLVQADFTKLAAVTSTAAELNLIDGVSGLVQADFTKLAAVGATAAELNTLTGVTAVVAELNALDLGSTAIGTAIASKAVVLDANKDSSGIRRLSVTRANVPQQALTSGSNAVAWDASAKPNAYHLTTENTTFAAPSNAVEGAYISLEIEYDGSHSIGWNTIFEFAASTEPTETATDGKSDLHTFRYNGAIWQEVGRSMNLSAT